jgi:hypothetical protein
MAYVTIPLQLIANQEFSVVLDGATLQGTLTTTDYGLYLDATYDGVSIAAGRICLDRTNINSDSYLGLPQALFFADVQGISDPVYTGFNTRYLLLYGNPQDNGGTTIG